MIDDLLQYLPYILPTRSTPTTDKVLETTSHRFKLMYGDTILKLLWHIGALPQSEKYIKKACLKSVIEQVTFFTKYPSNAGHFVWKKNGIIQIMPTQKMKKGHMGIYLQQKLEGNINPYDFMVEAAHTEDFNNKCIIGMTFQSLLILFEKLLSHVQTIEQNDNFNLNVSRLFHIVDATNIANNFCTAFTFRQPRAEGASKSAKLAQQTKQIVAQAVKNLNIPSSKALYSETTIEVKKEFKKISGKDFPRSDETLQKYIIEFAGH